MLDVVVGGLGGDVEAIGDLPRRESERGEVQHLDLAPGEPARVLRSEEDRVWAVFDWDIEGWQSFVSDPEVPPIIKEAGHKGKPQVAQFASECYA